jgi:hypothetical protein
MPQNRFVMLQFARPSNNMPVDLLIVDSKDGSPLQVWVHPEWEERVHPQDREYLSELMNEWRKANSAQIPAILDELSKQSYGPLRVIEQGQLSEVEGQALIKRFIGNAHKD